MKEVQDNWLFLQSYLWNKWCPNKKFFLFLFTQLHSHYAVSSSSTFRTILCCSVYASVYFILYL